MNAPCISSIRYRKSDSIDLFDPGNCDNGSHFFAKFCAVARCFLTECIDPELSDPDLRAETTNAARTGGPAAATHTSHMAGYEQVAQQARLANLALLMDRKAKKF